MRTNVLEVENLIRNYRKSVIKESEEDVKVLKGISFQVTEGEFVGIMGKSGCGKTTLLKTLGMIDKPTDALKETVIPEDIFYQVSYLFLHTINIW